MKIKVCGMRDKENIRQLASLKPDFIGFIFYEKSRRYADNYLDKIILHQIPALIKKVGVFVNSTFDNICTKIEQYDLNYVQLHGNESPELCMQIKNTGCGVIKVFSVSEKNDLKGLRSYEKFCDFFLFDTKCDSYGGSGKKFDWKLLGQYHNTTPLILSGGIDSDDADEIRMLEQQVNISAVDVNSRFETAPGLKDIQKIRGFITSLRSKG